MSDFLSKTLATPTSGDMASRKEALMNTVRQEVALAGAQELMNKASERCFTKCIIKPGDSLSSSEQTCLARCLDRYMEACECTTHEQNIHSQSKQRTSGRTANGAFSREFVNGLRQKSVPAL